MITVCLSFVPTIQENFQKSLWGKDFSHVIWLRKVLAGWSLAVGWCLGNYCFFWLLKIVVYVHTIFIIYSLADKKKNYFLTVVFGGEIPRCVINPEHYFWIWKLFKLLTAFSLVLSFSKYQFKFFFIIPENIKWVWKSVPLA